MSSTQRTRLPLARIDAIDALLGRTPAAPAMPPAAIAARPEEAADPDEVLRDYVLAPYPPRHDPRGGLRSVNFLVESFALAEREAQGVAIVERMRAQLGPGRTVWGVKHVGGVLSWELYVYDPGGERPEAAPAAVLDALGDAIARPPLPARPIAHHMWSLGLDAAALAGGPGAVVTVYVNGAREPGASRSYTVGAGGLALANLYTFHDPRTEPRAIAERLRESVHLGAPAEGIAAVLWPGLQRCRRLCVANKPRADGLYASGIDSDQLGLFLARTGWPAPLRAYLDARRARFAHLAWDVGFDFTLDAAAGRPRVDKSAVYATC